jgi:mannose/fructose/N-acetylgalactosamine-specific phosphotransferase system component IIC
LGVHWLFPDFLFLGFVLASELKITALAIAVVSLDFANNLAALVPAG